MNINEFEIMLLEKLQVIKCDFLDFIMPAVTFLGNAGVLWITLAAVMLCFRKTRKCGIAMAIALILNLLLCNLLLKNIVARIRPFDYVDTINLLIGKPTDFSFPSGHTLSSFACATVIWYYFRRFAGWIAVGVAAAIAFSRLYLQVHYPTDVLGGMILGVAFGILAIYLTKLITKKLPPKFFGADGERI